MTFCIKRRELITLALQRGGGVAADGAGADYGKDRSRTTRL